MENGENAYRRYLDGDDGGMTEIIRLYKDGLIIYINGFVRDILNAEELAEETFFRLAVKKPKFSGNSSFKTWLYTVGRNAAFDYLRKNGSGREISVNDCERLLISGSAENDCLKEERKQLVCMALSRLKPEYRKVLSLAFFEDFSNAQTAEIMKKSRRQVENLIFRAKKSLKAELLKEGFDCEDL